jgi:hypothetical protein
MSSHLAALESVQRAVWRESGPAHSHGPDWLLRYGNYYEGSKLPARYRSAVGQRGVCFRNCAEAAASDPTLRYCEGLLEVDGEIVSHAWCLDSENLVVELTLPTDGRVSHWAYWGVMLDAEVALDFMATVGVHSAGMLGQLTLDPARLGRRVIPLARMLGDRAAA